MIGSFCDLLLAVEVVVVGVLVVEGLDATGAAGKILQAAGVPRSVLHNRNISLICIFSIQKVQKRYLFGLSHSSWVTLMS